MSESLRVLLALELELRGRGDVHRVENVGAIPSVSVHVHGADISRQTRSRYDLERRAVIPFVQSYERQDSEAR